MLAKFCRLILFYDMIEILYHKAKFNGIAQNLALFGLSIFVSRPSKCSF